MENTLILIDQFATGKSVVVDSSDSYTLERSPLGLMLIERKVDGSCIPFETEEVEPLLEAIGRLGLESVSNTQFLVGVSEMIL